MALVLIWLTSIMGYRLILTPFFIVIGLAIYLSVLFLLKGIDKKDINLILKSMPTGEKISNLLKLGL